MELTKGQKKAKNEIINKLINGGYSHRHKRFLYRNFLLTISGFAGTGKTTLITELRKEIYEQFPHLNIAFVSFTGKASNVLYTKLKNKLGQLFKDDYIGTIHGLIYKPETIYDKELKTFVIKEWIKKDEHEFYHDIIIIDEASMVNQEIFEDLLTFSKTIISVGDSYQLPPVGDKFNLLQSPDLFLDEIKRQVEGSEIIDLSIRVRNEGWIPETGFFSNKVFRLDWNSELCQKIWNEKLVFDNNLIVLCGFNATRCELNKVIRQKKNITSDLPLPGEQVICLKNNHETKLMNGQIGTIQWMMPEKNKLYKLTLDVGQENPVESIASTLCFNQVTYTMFDEEKKLRKQLWALRKSLGKKLSSGIDYFDYGYVISVHKSQGSEWEKVVLIEQNTPYWDQEYYARWLYTGITRSYDKLFIISNYY